MDFFQSIDLIKEYHLRRILYLESLNTFCTHDHPPHLISKAATYFGIRKGSVKTVLERRGFETAIIMNSVRTGKKTF